MSVEFSKFSSVPGESESVKVLFWKLALQILTALVQGASIPVTCKIRILPTVREWN